MISVINGAIAIILMMIGKAAVLGQYNARSGHEGLSAAGNGCFTPDYTQGLCVPMLKCRRIEWLLENWSPPYPAHIARYIRQSHCGSQANVHYACCGFYDIHDHHHYSPQPPLIPKPFPSPSFIRNPHRAYHSAQQAGSANAYASNDPMQDHHQYHHHQHHHPRVNYLQQQPEGERILRSVSCGPLNGDRISHGEIVRLSEFPWMVLLESQGARSRQLFRCAGTLITNQYVLTAAHCAEPRNEVTSVRLGEHDLSHEHDCETNRKSRQTGTCAPPYEDVAIESITLHPDYKLNPLQNDIALIRLARPVHFNTHIKAICLPLDAAINSQMPTELIVAGWGVTENGYASNVLLKTNVPLHSLDVCQNTYARNRLNAPEHLCAGGVDRRSTCRADSGGPLFSPQPYQQHQVRYIQYGIVSAGSNACGTQSHLPGIYTNVGNYISWIIDTIY